MTNQNNQSNEDQKKDLVANQANLHVMPPTKQVEGGSSTQQRQPSISTV